MRAPADALTRDYVEKGATLSLDLQKQSLRCLGDTLRGYAALVWLDLSRNSLQSLAGIEYAAGLEHLNLYFNRIRRAEVDRLKSLPFLSVLDLRLNSLTRAQGYRMHVLKSLPGLTLLDNRPVTPTEEEQVRTSQEERRAARDGEQEWGRSFASDLAALSAASSSFSDVDHERQGLESGGEAEEREQEQEEEEEEEDDDDDDIVNETHGMGLPNLSTLISSPMGGGGACQKEEGRRGSEEESSGLLLQDLQRTLEAMEEMEASLIRRSCSEDDEEIAMRTEDRGDNQREERERSASVNDLLVDAVEALSASRRETATTTGGGGREDGGDEWRGEERPLLELLEQMTGAPGPGGGGGQGPHFPQTFDAWVAMQGQEQQVDRFGSEDRRVAAAPAPPESVGSNAATCGTRIYPLARQMEKGEEEEEEEEEEGEEEEEEEEKKKKKRLEAAGLAEALPPPAKSESAAPISSESGPCTKQEEACPEEECARGGQQTLPPPCEEDKEEESEEEKEAAIIRRALMEREEEQQEHRQKVLLHNGGVAKGGGPSGYRWGQSVEEVRVFVELPMPVTRRDVEVQLKRQRVRVSYKTPVSQGKGEEGGSTGQEAVRVVDALSGALSRPILVDESLWMMERRGQITLYLTKELLAEGPPGHEWWARVLQPEQEGEGGEDDGVDVTLCSALDLDGLPQHAKDRANRAAAGGGAGGGCGSGSVGGGGVRKVLNRETGEEVEVSEEEGRKMDAELRRIEEEQRSTKRRMEQRLREEPLDPKAQLWKKLSEQHPDVPITIN